ncbi:uncharacterized protein BX664DRAFT_388943 [Halteromyces radiatus]|uniref:uncharacterized protein n=1 Tax=Halteromyces radiatus TaxID=101107 RepID=UPI00221E5F42|nr:uncharacterized protein BX664DRAFT_388943 [Halteromyces radiatus]KAI8079995.1 hypothetical protein BX664DRAFT_388943 [Halteromyces radiatus]
MRVFCCVNQYVIICYWIIEGWCLLVVLLLMVVKQPFCLLERIVEDKVDGVEDDITYSLLKLVKMDRITMLLLGFRTSCFSPGVDEHVFNVFCIKALPTMYIVSGNDNELFYNDTGIHQWTMLFS